MIISGKQVQDILKVYSEQTSNKGKSSAKAQAKDMRRDEVVLSPKAQEFTQMLQKLKTMPQARRDKVEELAARIETGSYHIDAKDIADKMIARTVADRLI